MESKLSRRSFLKGAATGTAGIIGASALAACGPNGSQRDPGKDTGKWDYESDVVIVGSGTGLVGAYLALEQGHTVTVVEKAPSVGGTTILSSCGLWIPCNRWIADTEYGPGWTEDEALAFLKTADLYRGSTEEAKIDYIRNFRKVAEYIEDSWGFKLVSAPEYGNYDKGPYDQQKGNTVQFDDGEGGYKTGTQVIAEGFVPRIEELGGTILTSTRATSLIRDDDGRVIGLTADSSGGEIRVRGEKCVLLAAGGFDHNQQMREAYLRAPLFGSLTPPTNEGDGIRLGQSVGADLGNMPVVTGTTVYLTAYDGPDDWTANLGAYDALNRAATYSILVNKRGRRFMDEATPYALYVDSVTGFDSRDTSHVNIPAYFLFTDKNVALAGWPGGGDERPEWVGEFNTLDEAAEAYGIDAENLKQEVERFNGFCDTGKDVDFGRGEAPVAATTATVFTDLTEGNTSLGKIEPPYYIAIAAPASFGTRGGLRVDLDSRVVGVDGETIDGLYCAGTNSSGVLGSTYGGPGGGCGPGFYRSFRAISDALQLDQIEWE